MLWEKPTMDAKWKFLDIANPSFSAIQDGVGIQSA